jgi:hypothetical protein
MHTVHNLRLCPYDKIKLFINSCHYHVTNIYGCLVNSENRRSDKKDGALRALDRKKLGKAINHCFLFIKKTEKICQRFDTLFGFGRHRCTIF